MMYIKGFPKIFSIDLICYHLLCLHIVIFSQVVYQIIIFDKTLYDICLSKRFFVVIFKGRSRNLKKNILHDRLQEISCKF